MGAGAGPDTGARRGALPTLTSLLRRALPAADVLPAGVVGARQGRWSEGGLLPLPRPPSLVPAGPGGLGAAQGQSQWKMQRDVGICLDLRISP